MVDATHLTIGGSGAIFAAGAARLELRTALIAVVGDDVLGRFQLDALARRGVDVSGVMVDPERATGLSVILTRPDDRAILTSVGTIDALERQLVDMRRLRGARHVHVTSYFLQHRLRPGLPALLADARAAGLSTSLDTNWDPTDEWDAGLEEVLEHVDVLLPNAAEARRIAGVTNTEAAVRALAERVPVVAVKLGADGAIAAIAGDVFRAPAHPVEVVDATGAGDSFDAGFLAGRAWDWPVERALALACACGSLSTRAVGGVDAQPTLEEGLALAGE